MIQYEEWLNQRAKENKESKVKELSDFLVGNEREEINLLERPKFMIGNNQYRTDKYARDLEQEKRLEGIRKLNEAAKKYKIMLQLSKLGETIGKYQKKASEGDVYQ